MKAKLIFIGEKKIWKTQNKNCHFPAPPISIQFTISEQKLKFKACKFVEIDAICIEMAQQIKLSGCPTNSHFTAKAVNGVNCVNPYRFACFKLFQNGKLDIGGAGKWQVLVFGTWFLGFSKNVCFVFPQWKSSWLSYEVSFFSTRWMVSSESWKRFHSNTYAV